MARPRIAVVGSNMVDLITYIRRMPNEGETIEAPRFEMGFGGKGANQAVAAALLGADVCMVTKVGDDLFGPNTKKNLERYGINTSHVEIVPGRLQRRGADLRGREVAQQHPHHQGRQCAPRAGGRGQGEGQDPEKRLVILQLEVRLETVYHTIELCASHKVPVILNPAPADPTLDADRIRGVSFFAPNETELQTLTGMPTASLDEVKAAARTLLKKGIERIIVTLGEKGCLLLTGQEEKRSSRGPRGERGHHRRRRRVHRLLCRLPTSRHGTSPGPWSVPTGTRLSPRRSPGTQKSFVDRATFEAARV